MAVERTLNIIRTGLIAAGAGRIAVSTYRELKREGSPLRIVVLNQISERIGLSGEKDHDTFLYQIPGRWRTAGLAADILAQPGTIWNSETVLRAALTRDLPPEESLAFCIEAKPADPTAFPGLYVVQEHGFPLQGIKIPGAGEFQSATVRYYLAGRKHLPSALVLARDTSS